jgi:hypothetical protein
VDPGEGEEFGSGPWVFPQRSKHARCDGGRADRADTPQRHAGVFGFDHDADAFGVKLVGEPVCDLLGEPFLHLRPTRKVLDDTRQLRQTEDSFIWLVPDMGNAHERKQMMLADRPDRNRASEDKLLIAFIVGKCCQVKGACVNSSTYARAMRRGVSRMLSASRETPNARMNCSAADAASAKSGMVVWSVARNAILLDMQDPL